LHDDIAALPDDSRIELVESTDDRLVINLQTGGARITRMGGAVIAYVIFVCYISQPQVLGHVLRARAPPDLTLMKAYFILGLSWVMAVWLLVLWTRLQFEHTTLLLEHDRLVVERILFGWSRIEDFTFKTAPCALLGEAYRGYYSRTPHYRTMVTIQGQDVRVRFGRYLTDAEKDWLIGRINRFLRAKEPSE